jgi:hypothetical protein
MDREPNERLLAFYEVLIAHQEEMIALTKERLRTLEEEEAEVEKILADLRDR